MQVWTIEESAIRLLTPGRLMPWLGPALRGIVARELKNRVCVHPPLERRRWESCGGCPHHRGCVYGETFEPEPHAQGSVFAGHQAVRLVFMAPAFPLPEQGEMGLEIPLCLTGIGNLGASARTPLLETLSTAATRHTLGRDGLRFELMLNDANLAQHELAPGDLPAAPDALPGVIPRMRIGLTSPLFLAGKDQGRKSVNLSPSFADLFRASLRTLGHLFAQLSEPLNVDFAGLKTAAEEVEMLGHWYEPFRQKKWSSRGQRGFEMAGVSGGATFADIPMSLLPWMLWGGRLHVGTHRVAGAGGWRLMIG